MRPIVSRAARGLVASLALDALASLYPEACALCGAEDAGDGAGCERHRIHAYLEGPRCGRCARALPHVLPHGATCAACRTEPPGFARAACLTDYAHDEVAREWVLALKHRGRADLALPLGRLLGARLLLEPRGEEARVLVPVPLHRLRALERGYDQARLLAEAAAPVCDLPLVRALVRTRRTAPQGSPAAASRAANVRGAFRARRGIVPFVGRGGAGIEGREVWLVDDVLTSGATASECARELRRLGAARVNVLALARA